jgi:hypothetical protein
MVNSLQVLHRQRGIGFLAAKSLIHQKPMNTSILVIFALSNKFGVRNSRRQFLSQWKGCFSLNYP